MPWGDTHEPSGKDPCSHTACILVQRLSQQTSKQALALHWAVSAAQEENG